MWLNGLGCKSHMIYFGANRSRVESAGGRDSPVFLAQVDNEENVVHLKKVVRRQSTYYWRVDAICEKNVIYRGDVWEFTTL